MTDGTENNGDPPKPATPGFKKFAGAKLVPPPAPIQQLNGDERFPTFLGVGIVFSILVLITVFVLSFTTTKKKAPAAPPAAASATPAPGAQQ